MTTGWVSLTWRGWRSQVQQAQTDRVELKRQLILRKRNVEVAGRITERRPVGWSPCMLTHSFTLWRLFRTSRIRQKTASDLQMMVGLMEQSTATCQGLRKELLGHACLSSRSAASFLELYACFHAWFTAPQSPAPSVEAEDNSLSARSSTDSSQPAPLNSNPFSRQSSTNSREKVVGPLMRVATASSGSSGVSPNGSALRVSPNRSAARVSPNGARVAGASSSSPGAASRRAVQLNLPQRAISPNVALQRANNELKQWIAEQAQEGLGTPSMALFPAHERGGDSASNRRTPASEVGQSSPFSVYSQSTSLNGRSSH